MRWREYAARAAIVLLVLAAVAVPVWARLQAPIVHARMAENGGWSVDSLRARVGQPLHVRLTSDDVMHGFAVGQIDMRAVDVLPGKVSDVNVTFPRPGRYTFYCTRWCGVNHWRMRGTIEVTGLGTGLEPAGPPLYVRLGLDLDAPHEAPMVPDSQLLTISDESALEKGVLSQLASVHFYREHSPYEAWKQLRENPALSRLDDGRIWNMVAFLWQSNTSAGSLAEGKQLYAQNCAACHGESGRGDGVFAEQLASQGAGMSAMQAGMIQRPASFTDAKRMLGASPALLQGKILRGGMGTGMPSWGPIFTDEQTWELVAALYSFQFRY